jgi:hypothetical protein
MGTGFKNRLETPYKTVKNPWNFEQPCYDDRNVVNAGSIYGVGKAQPIGSKEQKSTKVIPEGRVNTLSWKRNYGKSVLDDK